MKLTCIPQGQDILGSLYLPVPELPWFIKRIFILSLVSLVAFLLEQCLETYLRTQHMSEEEYLISVLLG